MSIVVAVTKGTTTVIGCDSKFSDGNLLAPTGVKQNCWKLHRVPGAVIGHVGNTLYHTVLDHLCDAHAADFDFSSRLAVYRTMLQVHDLMVQECRLVPQGDDVAGSGLNLLVATADAIYHIEPELAVDHYARFWAIGSGNAIALGALDAIYDRLDDPHQIAEIALQAACRFDLHSNEPYTIEAIC